MDVIYIRDLKIECVIGVYEWERRVKQTVILDLDLAADIRRAAKTDRIDDTVNYKAVTKCLTAYIGASDFQLVETLAERVAEILLKEFGLPWVRVKVNKKGALRGATDVGVIIERSRV